MTTPIKTPLPEDVAQLIQALIENGRCIDSIDLRLYEGTGEAPREWIERGHLSSRLWDALEARGSEVGPVVARLLGEEPDPQTERLLRLLQRRLGS